MGRSVALLMSILTHKGTRCSIFKLDFENKQRGLNVSHDGAFYCLCGRWTLAVPWTLQWGPWKYVADSFSGPSLFHFWVRCGNCQEKFKSVHLNLPVLVFEFPGRSNTTSQDYSGNLDNVFLTNIFRNVLSFHHTRRSLCFWNNILWHGFKSECVFSFTSPLCCQHKCFSSTRLAESVSRYSFSPCPQRRKQQMYSSYKMTNFQGSPNFPNRAMIVFNFPSASNLNFQNF